MTSPHLKAVIFDIGGVVVKSPLLAIYSYERELGLPKDYINVLISRRGDGGAWQKFERGEMTLFDFYEQFSRDLSDAKNGNIWYREYCHSKGTSCPRLPDKVTVDGRELFGRMMRESSNYDPLIIEAVRRIKQNGRHRVIALTNAFNKSQKSLKEHSARPVKYAHVDLESEWKFLGWAREGGATPTELRERFDDWVDSSEAGMRKPDPAFYLHACKRNGVEPREVVMLDDLGVNLRAAKKLGMETIHVQIGHSKKSLEELEVKLGLDLLGHQGKL